MNPTLWMLFIFIAGVLTFLAGYSILTDLFLRDRAKIDDRVDEEIRQRQRARVRKSSLFKKLDLVSEVPDVEQAKPPLAERLELFIEQSGVNTSLQQLMVITGVIGLGIAALVGFLSFHWEYGFLAGLLCATIPFSYVALKRKARLAKLMSQLPDAFDLMARVIRAGQTITQAFQAVADEFAAPLGVEFGYCYEQQNLGLSPELALRDLSHRTGLVEIKIFVLALLVQQQTGGNLAELLDKLSTVIRERMRIQGKIKALTAEGRMQAAVLLALPPFLLIAILFLNYSYAKTLLEQPYLLVGMFVAELCGGLWIRKIINFDF
jgi:tight adherence protein B